MSEIIDRKPSKKEFDEVLDNMTEDVWLENWQPFIEKYINIFGSLPSMNDFNCSRSEYTHALIRAIEERKELSEYLQKRT